MLGLVSGPADNAAAGGGNGSSAGVGGVEEGPPNEVVQRWCGRLFDALRKCFAARA